MSESQRKTEINCVVFSQNWTSIKLLNRLQLKHTVPRLWKSGFGSGRGQGIMRIIIWGAKGITRTRASLN